MTIKAEINGSESAFPAEYISENGLTKREHFAGLAMQALLSCAASGRLIAEKTTISKLAVGHASALLEELARTEK